MHIIMGSTGHIGLPLVKMLLAKNEKVLAIARNKDKAKALEQQGALISYTDITNPVALNAVFQKGKTLFILNPPADVTGDTDLEEKKTINAIAQALENTHFDKVVVMSTYGAQMGEHIGDLGTLYALEQAVLKIIPHATIMRSAFLMSNWLPSLPQVDKTGVLNSFYPLHLSMPMVAPYDVAALAATLLCQAESTKPLYYIEGPQPYTMEDVIKDMSTYLKKTISFEVIEQGKIMSTYEAMGFSKTAALSYTNMALKNINGEIETPKTPIRGKANLLAFLNACHH